MRVSFSNIRAFFEKKKKGGMLKDAGEGFKKLS